MRFPSRAFGTVVILSIMIREALFKPLRSVGSMSAAISNQLFGLGAVPVVGTQPEAGFKQSLRDRQAHVADADKSEFAFFACDRIHV
jgi:hypothetical protein